MHFDFVFLEGRIWFESSIACNNWSDSLTDCVCVFFLGVLTWIQCFEKLWYKAFNKGRPV